ncbi:hypothetical protein HXX76_002942 [Chlamydomonas incerta]|uniref:F-box domain-containing protein n=1 Tax=Chlamydomonas incerta TaxID=51695 RepID=A0A835TG48_CHLIN|nr:hypothetical protein HXX76_002942 [Chlamydomonas incerta]|eukprot:KAG2442863.1 hypothetical protein HXX76_002942 [Chlamydomonas incerta]
MTFAGWLLAETGELSPLLPGTCPADVLDSGPTFELSVRSSPPAKLIYGHVPTANVNAAASRIAGHSVKGDACLLVSALTSSSSSSSGGGHPSVLLPSPDLLLDSLLGGTRLAQQLLARPREPHPHAQGQTQSAAAASAHKHARCPHAAISAILQGRNALTSGATAGHAAAAAAAATARSSDGSGALPAEATAARSAGLLGRAPSWEAPLAPPCKSARNSLESPPHPPHLSRAPHRPAYPAHALASALAAAVAAGDGIARPASPGVSRLARQLADSLLGGSGGALGGLQDSGAAAGTGISSLAHKRRHSGEANEAALGSDALAATAATAAVMELDADGAVVVEPSGLEAILAVPKAWRSLQQQEAVSQQESASVRAEEAQQAAGHAARQPPVEVEVPWQELPCDVVAYVATQLPQQASQAAAMAGVCRGWRVALLGNMPALRRVTFNLDPASHLRTSTRTRSNTTTPAASGGPDGSSATGSGGGGGAGVGLRRRSAARDASGGAAERSKEEEEAMAAALSRQYGAGAFVLPSAHSAAGGLEGMEGAEHFGAGAAGEQRELDELHAQEPVVPRAAARRPPLLLLEAARGASNPSAQLLMAQLLEGSGDADGSLRWWRKLAISGDVMGMFKLGMACYDGSHGMQSDPEAAHMWLSRAVRHILQVDSLSAIQLDEQHGGGPGAPTEGAAEAAMVAATAAAAGAAGGAGAGAGASAGGAVGAGGAAVGGQPRVSLRMRRKLASLDPTLLRMLGWSSIVLGYLEFDGVAGRSVWGMGDRSEAVRLFRLAEGCGCTEAAAVLGWLYNTGQY